MPVSRVKLHNHPVHPMLVVYPIAFFSSSFPADLLYVLHGATFWAWLALLLNAMGTALGLLAAAVGLVDFVGIPRVRRRTTGWSHLIAGLALLGLGFTSTLLRLADPATMVMPIGLAMSAAMLALTVVTGWLGGTLSFRYGIGAYGPSPTARRDGR
jgi:uncharacterized membrane protein